MEIQKQATNGALKNGSISVPHNGKVLMDEGFGDVDSFNLTSFMSSTMQTKRANDIKPSDKKTKVTEIDKFLNEGEELIKLSEKYSTDFINRGNEALYQLLASVYSFALRIEEHYSAENIVAQMKKKLKESEIKISGKAGAMATAVRFVIRSDKKTSQRYAKVLEIAKQENLSPQDLPAYISRRGGVSQIQYKESVAFAKKQGSKESKERLDLIREYYKFLSYRDQFPIIDYEEDVYQHNFEKQTAAETSQFVIMLAANDDMKREKFKILSVHDLGKTFEDVLLKFITKGFPSSLVHIEAGIKNLKKDMLENDVLSDGLRASLEKDIAKPFKYQQTEVVEVEASEINEED